GFCPFPELFTHVFPYLLIFEAPRLYTSILVLLSHYSKTTICYAPAKNALHLNKRTAGLILQRRLHERPTSFILMSSAHKTSTSFITGFRTGWRNASISQKRNVNTGSHS